jgi:glucose/arabinose dehydrogenase
MDQNIFDTGTRKKKVAHIRNGRIYVPQGAPCNTCNPDLPYASLTSVNTTGGDLKYHARGIRNTVGFDWHPTRDELWFTDNGKNDTNYSNV